MPSTKITNLTSRDPAKPTDEIPINRAGLDGKITLADLYFDDGHGIKSNESGNPSIALFESVASAVNYLEITNAATGNPIQLSAVGGDAPNVGMFLNAGYFHLIPNDAFSGVLIHNEATSGGTGLQMETNVDAPGQIAYFDAANSSDHNINTITYQIAGFVVAVTDTAVSAAQSGVMYLYAATAGALANQVVIGDGVSIGDTDFAPGQGSIALARDGGDVSFFTSPAVNVAGFGLSDSPDVDMVFYNVLTNANILFYTDGGLQAQFSDGVSIGGGLASPGQGNLALGDAKGIYDNNVNEQLIFQTTASAVNYLEITNAATGTTEDGPLISAAGSDTNIAILFRPKGASGVHVLGNAGASAAISAISNAGLNGTLFADDSSGDIGFFSNDHFLFFVDGYLSLTTGNVGDNILLRPADNTELIVGSGVSIGDTDLAPGQGNLQVGSGGQFIAHADQNSQYNGVDIENASIGASAQARFHIASGSNAEVSFVASHADNQSNLAAINGALVLNTLTAEDIGFETNDSRRWTIDDSAGGDWVSGSGVNIEMVASHIEFSERSDPAAGAANTGRLYVRDNGSGKSQLVCRFNTGAIQVICTEP